MATVDINGISFRYEDTGGDKPAVLFSHGFMMDHTMFDEQVAGLSDSYRCIRWDERGFGDTKVGEAFSYWDSADDAIAILDACGVDKAVLVGMSQGGFLSLRAALAHPDRVAGVVLIDSAADADDAEMLAGYEAMLGALTGMDDATWEATAEAVAGLILGTPELIAQWVPKWRARRGNSQLEITGATLLGRDDVSDRMGEIACPLLVIHGSEDQAIDPSRSQAVADAVQDSRGVVMVPGAAHAPNMSQPGIVNDALRDFFQSVA